MRNAGLVQSTKNNRNARAHTHINQQFICNSLRWLFNGLFALVHCCRCLWFWIYFTLASRARIFVAICNLFAWWLSIRLYFSHLPLPVRFVYVCILLLQTIFVVVHFATNTRIDFYLNHWVSYERTDTQNPNTMSNNKKNVIIKRNANATITQTIWENWREAREPDRLRSFVWWYGYGAFADVVHQHNF